MGYADDEKESNDAAAYGRSEGCFTDYLKPPFQFRHLISNLHSIPGQKDANGLLDQTGLCKFTLPKVVVEPESFQAEPSWERLLDEERKDKTEPPMSPQNLFRTFQMKELKLPLELVELGYDSRAEMRNYQEDISKRYTCDLASQWLPLSPVRSEKNEGFSFPTRFEKFRSLLLREIELERISTPDLPILLGNNTDATASELSSGSHSSHSLRPQRSRPKLDTVTPPLSPVSEDTVIFEPPAEACTIDLTAEPSTPDGGHAEHIHEAIRNERVDSEHLDLENEGDSSQILSHLPNDSASGLGVLQQARLDVPLLSMGSSPHSPGGDIFHSITLRGYLGVLEESDTHLPEGQCPIYSESFFDDAFAEVLDARCSSVRALIEQENFDPMGSASRINVPCVDFTISTARWRDHISKPSIQFNWIRAHDLQLTSSLRRVPDAKIYKELKWAPFPANAGRVSLLEAMDGNEDFFDKQPSVSLSSADYVNRGFCLLLVRDTGEEEISDSADIDSEHDSEMVSTHFRPSKADSQASSISTNLPPIELESMETLMTRRAMQKTSTENTLLPLSNDAHTTTKLLTSFMDMRAIKRRRSDTRSEHPLEESDRDNTSCLASTQQAVPDQFTGQRTTVHRVRLPAPEYTVPPDKGAFIISLGLKRSIVRNLEASWPQDHLLDRDHSAYENVSQDKLSSHLHTEAELTLTPGVGVVVTTLLKAKQKSLPQSQTLPQLRQRILTISQKYELLYVLVSEAKLSADDPVGPSASDLFAYADFVRFTCALDAGIMTVLVPGADDNMSSWILSLMCQYSPHALAFKRFLNGTESTWEVFLRRAGMNVMAAQVLAGSLFEEVGNGGLAQFLAMPLEERISAYGQLLGGEKNLILAGRILDQVWG